MNTTEAILASMDGIKRAEAPPFLYGRIQAKLNRAETGFFEKLGHLISRPVISISLLFLILFVDGIVIKSTSTTIPAKSENAFEVLLTSDFDETLFYDSPESEYASYLIVQN